MLTALSTHYSGARGCHDDVRRRQGVAWSFAARRCLVETVGAWTRYTWGEKGVYRQAGKMAMLGDTMWEENKIRGLGQRGPGRSVQRRSSYILLSTGYKRHALPEKAWYVLGNTDRQSACKHVQEDIGGIGPLCVEVGGECLFSSFCSLPSFFIFG